MHLHHAAVWVDHHEAKIFHVDDKGFDVATIHSPHRHVRRHSIETAEHDHPADAERFYHEVAKHLENVEKILIVGPATAKLELVKHLHKHHHALVPRVIGVETVDHPTDGQMAAYVRRYLLENDRMG